MLHMSEDKKKIPKVQYNRIIEKIKKGDNPQINVSYLFICLEPYITIFLTELTQNYIYYYLQKSRKII